MNISPRNDYLVVQHVQPEALGKIELINQLDVPQKEALVIDANASGIVKDGDRICMRLNAGSPALINGKALLFIKEEDVFCVMEKV